MISYILVQHMWHNTIYLLSSVSGSSGGPLESVSIAHCSVFLPRYHGFLNGQLGNSLTCKIDGQMKCVAGQRDRRIGGAPFRGESRVFRLCGAHCTVNCKERDREGGRGRDEKCEAWNQHQKCHKTKEVTDRLPPSCFWISPTAVKGKKEPTASRPCQPCKTPIPPSLLFLTPPPDWSLHFLIYSSTRSEISEN